MKHPGLQIILLLALSSPIHSQSKLTDSVGVAEFRKWTIGLSISPAYSYRKLKPFVFEDPYAQLYLGALADSLADSLNILEKGKLAFSIGLEMSYHFNRRISLRAGLYYSDKGIAQKGFLYYDNVGRVWRTHEEGAVSKTSFMYWEHYIALEYGFTLNAAGTMRLSVFGGPAMCMNAERHEYSSRRMRLYPDPIEKAQPFFAPGRSLLHTGIVAGLCLNFNVGKRVVFSAEPVLKYYLKTWYSPDFLTEIYFEQYPVYTLNMIEAPYSLGCNLVVRYSFGDLLDK